MKLFRQHRGALTESMETVEPCTSGEELRRICSGLLGVADEIELTVTRAGFDERINWDAHIVAVAGYGVIGFTDGPVEDEIKSVPCSWCQTDPAEAAKHHEGPHATWCPHFRRPPKPKMSLVRLD